MLDALVHPKIVHIPMALGILMPLVAGGMLLAWWRDWLSRRGWFVAIGLQAILVVSGLVAMRTGEVDEERVEQRVAEAYIEPHEEAAERFVWAAGGVLAVMLVAAALGGRRRAGIPIAAAATLGTIAVLGLGYRTGQAGGSLVYEHGAAQALAEPTAHPRAAHAVAIPASLTDEHAELHAALANATRAGGRTGAAAAEVAELLHPHFVKEEAFALPPLAVLSAIAAGHAAPDREILDQTAKLEAELPRMLEEHAAIVAALDTLEKAATEEREPEVADFARRLTHHATQEEQILYPAAILVGKYLRLRFPPAAG